MRQLYYQRIGAEKEPHSARTLAIFESGNMLERNTVDFLRAEMEIEWVRSQQAAPKTELNIGCRIDGGIRGIRQQDQPLLIAEVKRVNRNEWAKITDCDQQGIHDMLRAAWWIRRYPYQGSAYLHLYGEPGVIFILREPSSGWAKFVPLVKDSPIDLQLWGEIQTRAKYLNACVEANDCPEPIPFNKSVCGMCDYRDTVCHPAKQHEGVEVLDHPDVVTAAAEYLELREFAQKLNEKREYLREIAIATGRDHIMLGDVAEVKVRGDKTKTVTIRRPKGGSLFFGEDNDE
jgi:hypothetical protein